MWMISHIVRILFPPTCFGCSTPNHVLCKRCIGLARKSLSQAHPFIFSTFDFRDPLIKRIVHAIKYHNRRDLVAPLIPSITETLRMIPEYTKYTLVPIPMPTLRKLFRGYNQSELLAMQIGVHANLPVRLDILKRKKNPSRQATIHEKQRRIENQKGSFCIVSNVKDVNIMLIDDVTTTGATIDESRAVLLKAGAANVLAITLAH